MIRSCAASPAHAPLAVAQEALWDQGVLAPRAVTYNEAVSLRRDGPLDVGALRRAFNEVVRRHAAWHTTFELHDGRPAQVLRRPAWHELPVIDLGALEPEAAERRAVALVADAASLPYDLARGPLLRPRLIRFSGDHHRLYLALHHLIFDGTSMNRVVLPELAALYRAFADGDPSPLAAPAAPYADYARWEQRWISEPRAQRRLAYWHEHLRGAPTMTLPTDRRRPAAPRAGGGELAVDVPAVTAERLREIARDTGASFFQVLAAAWATMLAGWTGQDEVVFATVANLRQRPEHQSVVGYAVTPLVLRAHVGRAASFAELVGQVRDEVLDALDHLIPFERVVRELELGGRGAGDPNPLYQTMIVLEPAAAATEPGWSMHQMESDIGSAVGNLKVDLELQLDERPGGQLAGRLIYDRDLFDPSTAGELVVRWARTLATTAGQPEPSSHGTARVGGAHPQPRLAEVNATVTAYGARTVLELLDRAVARDPDAPAVTAGRRTVTYAELDALGVGVATRLHDAGLGAGAVVAVCAAPSIELIAGMLGTLRSGASYVVCSAPGDVPTLGVDAALIMPGTPPLRAGLTPVALHGSDDRSRPRPVDPPRAGSAATVATTPDGAAVAIAHETVLNHVQALVQAVALGPADTVLALPALLGDPATLEPWPALASGARLVIASPEAAADGARLSRRLRADAVTFVHAPPATWEHLLDTGLRGRRALRALCSGGAPLSRPLADRLLRRCRVLWSGYGAPWLGGCRLLERVQPSGPVTVGRPLANTRAHVLDSHGRPLGADVAGELCLAGIGIDIDSGSPGGGRLVAEPGTGGPALRTGEHARQLADGRLELLAAGEATTGIEPV